METKHKNVNRTFTVKSYKCKICGVEFIHRINFDIHYKNHLEDETPVCSFINIFNKFNKCA
jgi:hypothetical protein